MTLTKVLPQDLLNDIVPAGEDKPAVGNSKYYGTDASGDFGFFPGTSLGTTPEVYRGNTAPATPSTGRLWVDTSGSGEVLKQWNGTARSELDHLSVSTIAADATIGDSPTLLIVDGNSGLPINITLPTPISSKGRRIEIYKYRGSSQVNLITPAGTITNVYSSATTTYAFKNTNPLYFMSVRNDGSNWIVDDDNIYNRVANTLFVDLNFGDNTRGTREFESRPFSTVSAAVAASQPLDTIVLRNGNYSVGAITIPHNLNIVAEKGTVLNGAFIIGSTNKLSYYGGDINGSANIFQLLGSGSVDFEVDTLTLTGPAIRINDSIANTNNKIRFRVGKHINNTVSKDGFIKTTASGSSTGLDIDGVIYSTEGGFGSFFAQHQVNSSNVRIVVHGDIDFGSSAVQFFVHPSGINNRFDIRVYGKLSKTGGTVSSPAFRALGTSGNINNFIVDEYIGGCFIHTGSSIGNEFYIGGNKHISNILEPVYYIENSSSIIGGVSTPNKLVINTTEAYNTATTTAAINAGGYTSNLQGIVLGIYRGGDVIINSKIMKSTKGHVIGVDYFTGAITPVISQTVLDINGTFIERLGKDLGVGYGGAIFFDKGTDTGSSVTIRFNNGVVINNYGDQLIIDGFAGTSPINIEYNDDIKSNVSTIVSSVDKITYTYQPTTTITASGTYTVLDNENDLYYDLTLGNLTLVLPDPAKFVNRELSIKVTATHATNTITIDPVGAALIDGAATYVIPNTSTIRPNVVVKSDGTQRWIK